MTSDKRPAVLVTGASSGIGKAIALTLLQSGFRVFGTVRRAEDGRYLPPAGGTPLLLDVTQAASISRAVKTLDRFLGKAGLFALINNAGISICAPWELVASEDFRAQLEVNLVGVAAVTRALLPRLRQSRGRIIMISSTSGRLAVPLTGPYSCSKFALEALTDSLRRELLRDGIQVTSVQPGPTDTPIFAKSHNWAKNKYPRAFRGPAFGLFSTLAPTLGQQGQTPEDVARAVKRILLARRPPLRTVVARNRWFFYFLPWVPTRWLDRILSKVIYGSKP